MGVMVNDPEDASVIIVYLAAILSLVGISEHSVFGISASDSITQTLDILGGIDVGISVAGAAALGVWGFVLVTNDRAEIPNDDVYKGLVVSSGVLTAALVFFQDFAAAVAGAHDIVALIVGAVAAVGLAIIGFMK